jgi:hypothetical protein
MPFMRFCQFLWKNTAAIWITLLFAAGVFAQVAPNDSSAERVPLGSVTGRVIDSESKRPIGGAKLQMLGLQHGRNGTTTADLNGEFGFDKLPAGSYMFLASADGYRDGPTSQIDVSAGASLTIELTLIPEAGIAGRVVDEESRRPVAGITVKALREHRDFGSRRVTEAGHGITNKAGEYALSGLMPGKYFLVAEPPPADAPRKSPAGGLFPVPTWHPDALHKIDAVPVYVTAGHRYDGTDIHLRKAAGYVVSGAISGLPEIPDLKELTVRLAAEGESLYGERIATPDARGMFSFADVVPGNYTALLLCKTKDTRPGVQGATHLLAFADVLVDKSDVKDLRLPVRWPIAISGSASVDDSPDADLKGVHVMLTPTDGVVSGAYPQAELNGDGGFELPSCDPVRYAVGVRAPAGMYVRSITFNHRDVLPSDIIDASNGGGKLEVFFHKGGAELSGSVETQSGAVPTNAETTDPEARTLAVLIPVDWSPDWAIDLRTGGIDKGSFEIRNIRPGTYYALALEQALALWRNPGLVREMQSRGETVTLNEDEHLSVHLKLITASEVQQAARAVEQ